MKNLPQHINTRVKITISAPKAAKGSLFESRANILDQICLLILCESNYFRVQCLRSSKKDKTRSSGNTNKDPDKRNQKRNLKYQLYSQSGIVGNAVIGRWK